MCEKAARPAGDLPPEVEVTPEMIEAGLDEFYSHGLNEQSPADLGPALRRVFQRMLEARF